MEFTVMTCSFLQPNILICGTNKGDLYVLDSFSRRNAGVRIGICADITKGPECVSDPGQSLWRYDGKDINNLILAHFPNLFKSGISCIEFHPRLPSLLAVGLCDGSVHLLFLEGENLSLKKTTFLYKFHDVVHQLEWILVDRVNDVGVSKLSCKSFVDRIWKTLSKSPYHSVLVGRSGEDVRCVSLERNFKVLNLFDTVLDGFVPHNPCYVVECTEGGPHADSGTDGNIHGAASVPPTIQEVEHMSGTICLVFNIKWPLIAYFEKDLEYPTLTNFCKVRESLCVVRHNREVMYMEIYLPESTCSGVRFLRFSQQVRLCIQGRPTSVQISPKQYNQINRYLSTSNENLFNLNGEKCLNGLSEFIAIGTSEGHIYTTSMAHVYNVAHGAVRDYLGQSQPDIEDPNSTCVYSNTDINTTACEPTSHCLQLVDVTEYRVSSGNNLCDPSYANACLASDMRDINSASLSNTHSSVPYSGVADIDMSSCCVGTAVSALRWSLLWNDFTRDPYYIAPTRCCCTDDIAFLLTVLGKDSIDLLRLSKDVSGLHVSSYMRLNACCTSMHWVENTIPNDMTLWMSTSDGMECLTCCYEGA